MLHVTKTFLPSFEKYIERIRPLWDSHWLTNNGAMVLELEELLRRQLQISELLFTNNGTVVLQMAIKALGLTQEIITTPFSYVATTNAILWEGCTPVFADIREDDFNIDVQEVVKKITDRTQAILVTHVFGNPCQVEALEAVAKEYNLKLIYDAAHAFGVTVLGKSIFSYGDISTCSFHATKVFHTGEGGMINTNGDPELFQRLKLFRSFGHIGDDYYSVGVNAKSSELHAAMGLCVLEEFEHILEARKHVCGWYDAQLANSTMLTKPKSVLSFQGNYAYYPVVFSSEEKLLQAIELLKQDGIQARRYFYPSLNNLPFLSNTTSCPISESISARILCLPLSTYTTPEEVQQVAERITSI
jgi:dTDP-4-amino-4,6-dideoxygalactose transaminase